MKTQCHALGSRFLKALELIFQTLDFCDGTITVFAPLCLFPVLSMNSRKYHPYAHALRRHRREEVLNELRLAKTIAEEREEREARCKDDCDDANDGLLVMLVVLICLRILNAIFMGFVITLLTKI
ncbi:hypothetical protein GYMLUDRAFT_247923 [Collybiopsis luxurians FD-317 M1]|uniref:Uncharacterized protein n=1 Tax=Collybiopsis luxurians FD-317 M1 TaxID=944289 RepID=A0A0D0B071_9AGAR|nr:hypothetical protein GYMLUDRAFT_247923 [Collybiopsis luxurians FD-317 M1]